MANSPIVELRNMTRTWVEKKEYRRDGKKTRKMQACRAIFILVLLKKVGSEGAGDRFLAMRWGRKRMSWA